MRTAPEKYLYQRPEVREWLHHVRTAHGKLVFLITNSHIEYTAVLMAYSFGVDWRQCFDLTVVFAQKPEFFIKRTPFFEVDVEACVETNAVLASPLPPNSGLVVAQGNATDVHAALVARAKERGLVGDNGDSDLRVVYFGDHLISDVRATSTHSPAWRAGAIVEEMHVPQHAPPPDFLAALPVVPRFGVVAANVESAAARHLAPARPIEESGVIEATLFTASSALPLTSGRYSHTHQVAAYEALAFAPGWGSFFQCDNNVDGDADELSVASSAEPRSSFWSHFVAAHAAMCTACVTDLGPHM